MFKVSASVLMPFVLVPTLVCGTANADSSEILRFKTMYGVDGPFVGAGNPIRDVNGDDLPWEIEKAIGRLDTKGRLRIVVHGLVFKNDPRVPPGLVGKNDEAKFRGLVSCLTEVQDPMTSAEVVKTANVITKGFPATASGDSNIKAKIKLPNPCVAPIIMVLNGNPQEGDKWFAVTGFEAEEE